MKLTLGYYKIQHYSEEIEMDVNLDEYGLTLDKEGNIDEKVFYSNYQEDNEDEAEYDFDDALMGLFGEVEEKLCNNNYIVLNSTPGDIIEEFGHIAYTKDDRIIYENS